MLRSIFFQVSSFFNNCFEVYIDTIFLPILVFALVFFTIYLGFPQWRHGGHALRTFSIKGGEGVASSQGTSLFQSLATSLAGSIGMGSVTGVSLALVYGGPGTIFWMWIVAILGMSVRVAEVTFAHDTRTGSGIGREAYVGGPMYYMQKVLRWRLMARLYALAILLSAFIAANFTQSNSVAKLLEGSSEGGIGAWLTLPSYVTGIFFAVLVALVILGGLKRIARITELMIPFMGMVYFVLVCIILLCNYKCILPGLKMIVVEAFRPRSVLGMGLGSACWFMFSQGILFSFFATEMAIGTSGIVHSTNKEESSLRVGRVSMLEPVITVCFICTLTALAVLSSGGGRRWKDVYLQRADESEVRVLLADNTPYTGKLEVKEGVVESSGLQVISRNRLVNEFEVHMLGEDGKERREGNFFLEVMEGKIKCTRVGGGVLYVKAPLTGARLARAVFRVGEESSMMEELCVLLLMLCLLLFAFSTVISWSYYGEQALQFIGWGRYTVVYKLCYIMAVVLSAVLQAEFVWKLACLVITFAAFPNICALFVARKRVKCLIDDRVRGKEM